MGFLTLSTGMKPTGSEEAAFGSQFKIIPNNSKLLGFIQKIQKQYDNNWKIIWEIVQGQYKGQTIWQFLTLENQKFPEVADRNKEMFARIFILCGLQVPEIEPTVHILSQMERKVLGLKIIEDSYTKDGALKEINRITEVHPSKDFIEEIGVKLMAPVQRKSPKQTQAYNELNPPPFVDDDLPF